MKAKEVMSTLQITRQTLCNYVKKGLIQIDSKINGQYRYNKESVYRLLHSISEDEAKELGIFGILSDADSIKEMIYYIRNNESEDISTYLLAIECCANSIKKSIYENFTN